MSIKRSAPDVGYFDPAIYKQFNLSQTVRAGNTVYFSGIVSAGGNMEAVAKGDPGGQVKVVLGILGRLLAEEGMSFANLVSATVYTPEIEAIMAQLAIFAKAFEGHPPAFQMIGVKNLASPDYLLELVAVATLEN